MGENKDYKPDVYRRLELVQRQFKTNTVEHKKEQSRRQRQEFMDSLYLNRGRLGCIALYSVLGLLTAAVFLVALFD